MHCCVSLHHGLLAFILSLYFSFYALPPLPAAQPEYLIQPLVKKPRFDDCNSESDNEGVPTMARRVVPITNLLDEEIKTYMDYKIPLPPGIQLSGTETRKDYQIARDLLQDDFSQDPAKLLLWWKTANAWPTYALLSRLTHLDCKNWRALSWRFLHQAHQVNAFLATLETQ
jgi:hypothetical protein